MTNKINHINAGIISTQARMAGLNLEGALALARTLPLHCDLGARPHRSTVLRLLKAGWVRQEAEAARFQAQREAQESFDAAVAAAFPAEWAAAQAKAGKARREARSALRKRFAPERYNVAR